MCIDGYLWDADSCDEPGGGLSIGGETPCPQCNTIAFLKDGLERVKEGGCGMSMWTPYVAADQWERTIAHARRFDATATDTFLATVKPFVTDDWPDRQAVFDGRAPWDKTIERRWPWSQATGEGK
jgi:hypothetical protein